MSASCFRKPCGNLSVPSLNPLASTEGPRRRLLSSALRTRALPAFLERAARAWAPRRCRSDMGITAHARVGRSRPIRVAHLIHTMAHGGVETALINWFRTFDPRKVDARLL